MNASASQISFFRRALLQWHRQHNNRILPWKGESDPYKIWLSEIILQQTRAAQGLDYYLKFIEAYPDVCALAAAPDEAIFRLWQGLGYYNRCRNMLASARWICTKRGGRFPDTYEEILSLKGVGPYTAAAIASFGFGLPYAVVDGNVYRVLSRFFGIETAIDSTAGKKEFSDLAQQLLEPDAAAEYNQSIMDLGATICTPAQPNCQHCPFTERCVARRQQLTSVLPVKERKGSVLSRYFHYLVLYSADQVWIRKRTGKGIWQDLHEFYLIETEAPAAIGLLKDTRMAKVANPEWEHLGSVKQRLTHQLIYSEFYRAAVADKSLLPEDGFWVRRESLDAFAFPKTILSFMKTHL